MRLVAAMMIAMMSAAYGAEAPKPPAAPAKPAPVPATSGVSIWDGIYTKAQAKRGDAVYAARCAQCHQKEMTGKDPAPAVAGEGFLDKWYNHSVGELLERIATTMPADNPGKLAKADYVDVTALLLQANGFKAGQAEMKGEPAALNKVQIVKKKKP